MKNKGIHMAINQRKYEILKKRAQVMRARVENNLKRAIHNSKGRA